MSLPEKPTELPKGPPPLAREITLDDLYRLQSQQLEVLQECQKQLSCCAEYLLELRELHSC